MVIMARSVEFGLQLVAPPPPSSTSSSSSSSARSYALTLIPFSVSSSRFLPYAGWESVRCWLHHPLLPKPIRRFVGHGLARTEASCSSSDRPSKAESSGKRSVRNFDWLYASPAYPSSADKHPFVSNAPGAHTETDDEPTPFSRTNSLSPRQLFKSIGSRSVSSRPSIPGKFSKYFKASNIKRASEVSSFGNKSRYSEMAVLEKHEVSSSEESDSEISWQPSQTQHCSLSLPSTSSKGDDQRLYFPSSRQDESRKKLLYTDPPPMPATDLPFQFQFSYSEVPKADPIGYREPPFSPFGPSTLPRPWTGRAPLVQKKKAKQLDSFNPPLPGTKGVKAVHRPGPYLEGDGPKLAKTREEILGEPLTKEETLKLVETCNKEKRQINLGRDGLVHNMLDLIQCHWKRRRVIKFKCKGVPTIDMDNVCFHVEDKTGGKIIYRTGGVFYLFRGRHYNTKYRPHIPLMLWKPAAPIYPKLIVPAPGGLTKEEANEMRKRGRKVEPICKLCM